jgi:hypothetical protein
MKRTLSLAIAAMAAAASLPAQAANYSVSFSGIVFNSVGATGSSDGSTVSGSFVLTPGGFASFVINGMSVAPGFDSEAAITPDEFDAIYQAQVSPVATGGTTNSTFTLDLSSINGWPSADNARTLLTDTNQLANNLDTILNDPNDNPIDSSFSYYTANANGTNVVSLDVDLTSLNVAVPEPMSLALLATSMFGMGIARRRRG